MTDGEDGEPRLTPASREEWRAWFEARGLRPRLAAEFDDTALLKTFGRSGLGLFPAPAALADDLRAQYGAVLVGTLDGVREQFYVISNERRITHPAVEAMRAATAMTIFPPPDR